MFISKAFRQILLPTSRYLIRFPVYSPVRSFCIAPSEKLDEVYDNEMINRLSNSHETLTLPIKREATTHSEPKVELPSLNTLFSRTVLRIKNCKIWSFDSWLYPGKIEGYSPELKELNLAMLAMVYPFLSSSLLTIFLSRWLTRTWNIYIRTSPMRISLSIQRLSLLSVTSS